jgi:hypothetical protein
MKSLTTTEIISFESRLQRSRGRTGRTHSANVKLTKDELAELEAIAQSEKKALGEWAREVLLREARRSDGDAVFTEIVATRMLLVNLIKPLILGKPVTQDWITEAMSAVRREKRRAAQEVMQQYTDDSKGGR